MQVIEVCYIRQLQGEKNAHLVRSKTIKHDISAEMCCILVACLLTGVVSVLRQR